MAVSDPYGLLQSGLPPDLAAQYAGLQQQQMIVDALMKQSQMPLQAPEVKGRFQGRINPMEGIAKVVQAYMASKGLGDVNKGFADISSQRLQGVQDAMRTYQGIRDGSPASPSVPYTDTVGDQPPQQDIPGAPATPGNPRAALMAASSNAYLAGNPVVAADLDAMKKSQEPYSLKPNEQRYADGKVVAQGASPVEAVTAAGPNGEPVTRFVSKAVGTPDVPQPVKKEMVALGATVQPVNTYTQNTPLDKTVDPDAQLHAQVAVRGQNMVDARTRELNGILAGQGPADITPTAEAIANYDVKMQPPPTSSRNPAAMARYNELLSKVKEINPDWNAPNFDAAQVGLKQFTSGKLGSTVRSLGVAQNHLDTLDQAAIALQNGDSPAFNKVANLVAYQTGKSAPSNFEAIKQIVGDEVVKAVVGSGGGVHDREAAAATISSANSLPQLRGVIAQYKQLMGGQLGGLRQQYEQTTMRKDFDRFLSDQAKALPGGGESSSAGGTVLHFDAQGNPL